MHLHYNVHTVSKVYAKIPKKKLYGLKYFLIALPFMLFVFAFSYVPLFGWIYTLFDYKMGQNFFNITHSEFVGLGNIIKLYHEREEVVRVLRNTLVMSFLSIASSPLPVIFAIMLNEIKSSKYKKLIQTTTTLPNFISWIIVYGLAFSLFSTNGLVNTLLSRLGIPISDIGLLGDSDHVWVFQLGISIWKHLGWSAIIYIAAITGIDGELYDAIYIDGGNKFKAILHITVPGIIPTYLVLLLLSISHILSNGFDQYFMFYNSMVADKIEVLDYYVYKVGMMINDYSYSITIGMLKSFISIILLFTANAISKKLRGESLV